MNITCHELGYTYPGAKVPVLENFSLAIQPGTTLLKGYSGCGKSTLLRLLGGLIRPSSGRIEAPHLPALGSREFLRKSFAMVFQELNLLPLASVWRNIESPAGSRGSPPSRGANGWPASGWRSSSRASWKIFPVGRNSGSRSPGRCRNRRPCSCSTSRHPVSMTITPASFYPLSPASLKSVTPSASSRAHDHRIDPVAHDLVDFHRILPLAK